MLQGSWEITFPFPLHLNSVTFHHNIFTSNDFFDLWEQTSGNCKPYFVTIAFLSFTCSNLHFAVKNNEIACKSPSISMLILILIFQPGAVRLTVTVTRLLHLTLICLTFCLFYFFSGCSGHTFSSDLPVIIFKLLF